MVPSWASQFLSSALSSTHLDLKPADPFLDYSKLEALDRLSSLVRRDLAALRADIEREVSLQSTLLDRSGLIECNLLDLCRETDELKSQVQALIEEADVIWNWIRANDVSLFPDDIELAFEPGDERARTLIEIEAAENAIDDAIGVVEKAVEDGVVGVEAYVKQVKGLAREQFRYRAMKVKLMGCEL